MYIPYRSSFTSEPCQLVWIGEDEWCCSRCGRKESRLCCDTCHPESFLILLLEHDPSKLPRAKRKVNLNGFKMDSHDKTLLEALKEWRASQLKRLGLEHDDVYGAQLIVVDRILERIVSLARKSKIPDVNSLAAQTQWINAKKYGNAILEIIKAFNPSLLPAPPQPAPPNVLQNTDIQNISFVPGVIFIQDGPLVPGKQARQCGTCGSFDHIGLLICTLLNISNSLFVASNRKACPKWKENRKDIDLENTPTQSVAAGSSTQRKCSACGGLGHIGMIC